MGVFWTACGGNSRPQEQKKTDIFRRPSRAGRVSQAPQHHPRDLFQKTPGDEITLCVTGLERGEARLQHVALLYARRADTETVFNELRNQWGFRGYCGSKAVVTELAVHRRPLLPTRFFSCTTRALTE